VSLLFSSVRRATAGHFPFFVLFLFRCGFRLVRQLRILLFEISVLELAACAGNKPSATNNSRLAGVFAIFREFIPLPKKVPMPKEET